MTCMWKRSPNVTLQLLRPAHPPLPLVMFIALWYGTILVYSEEPLPHFSCYPPFFACSFSFFFPFRFCCVKLSS